MYGKILLKYGIVKYIARSGMKENQFRNVNPVKTIVLKLSKGIATLTLKKVTAIDSFTIAVLYVLLTSPLYFSMLWPCFCNENVGI